MKRVKKIAAGAGIAFAAYLALLALASLLMARGTVAEERTAIFVWIFACLASFLGTKASSYGEGDAIIPKAGCAAAFWGLIHLAGLLMNDTLEPARSAAIALPVAVGAAAAYLLRGRGVSRGKGRRKRRIRK